MTAYRDLSTFACSVISSIIRPHQDLLADIPCNNKLTALIPGDLAFYGIHHRQLEENTVIYVACFKKTSGLRIVWAVRRANKYNLFVRFRVKRGDRTYGEEKGE